VINAPRLKLGETESKVMERMIEISNKGVTFCNYLIKTDMLAIDGALELLVGSVSPGLYVSVDVSDYYGPRDARYGKA